MHHDAAINSSLQYQCQSQILDKMKSKPSSSTPNSSPTAPVAAALYLPMAAAESPESLAGQPVPSEASAVAGVYGLNVRDY